MHDLRVVPRRRQLTRCMTEPGEPVLPLNRSWCESGQRGLREIGARGGIDTRNGALLVGAQCGAGKQIGSCVIAGDGANPACIAPVSWCENNGWILSNWSRKHAISSLLVAETGQASST